MTRVLVCGGRDYDNEVALGIHLARIDMKHGPISLVIHGGARGADSLARTWAAMNDIPSRAYHADWTRYGRPAGPMRNQRMIDEGMPDLVVAFPGGQGTADMVRRAKTAGIEVIEVTPAPPRMESRMERAWVRGRHVVWCGVCAVKLELDGLPFTTPRNQLAIAADAKGWRKTRAHGWTCPTCKPKETV